MDDIPPRRSRRSTPPARGNALPFGPIIVGIIVLGFLIGAGLSLAGHRGGGERTVVANVVPTRQATLPPVTPAPSDPPPPSDAVTAPPPSTGPPSAPPASPALVTRAPATQAPATHAPPTRAAAQRSLVTPAPATATAAAAAGEPARVAAPQPSATLRAARVAARPATAPLSAAPAPLAAAADAPVSSDDADSEFAKLASAVVRQYVAAIERGDTTTAYAAFGPNAAGNVTLLESGTLDASTRIRHVEARGAGDNATVNVDLKTAKGLYFGQYTVHRTESGAALITDHALNRL
jgi:hypothetical protein